MNKLVTMTDRLKGYLPLWAILMISLTLCWQTNVSAHVCPSALIVIDGGREGGPGAGPGETLSMTEVEIVDTAGVGAATITNPGISVQYIIAGGERASSAASIIRQDTVGVVSGDDIVIDIRPRVIDDATDQVYTITAMNFGSAFITWQWFALDPDCTGFENCSGFCRLSLDVTAFDPFAPTDDDDGDADVDDGAGNDDDIFGCNSSLGIPQTKPMKKLMDKLRDRIESNWTVEHDYIELYNDNKKELTQIVNSHPALAIRLLSERTQFMPSILLLIFGEPVELATTDVKRIEAILDAISVYASPQLEDAIDQIRSDLHSEEIMSSFGISVE